MQQLPKLQDCHSLITPEGTWLSNFWIKTPSEKSDSTLIVHQKKRDADMALARVKNGLAKSEKAWLISQAKGKKLQASLPGHQNKISDLKDNLRKKSNVYHQY